jgi:hypothetical protein
MSSIKEILEGGESAPIEEVKEEVVNEADTELDAESEGEQPETEASERSDKQVPLAALQAERQKAKRYTEQVAEFEKRLTEQDLKWQQRIEQLLEAQKPKQEPVQPPDFWENPETAIDYRLQQMVSPIQQQLVRQREELSMMQAVDRFGQETVDKAFNSLKEKMATDPSAQAHYQQIMSSPHPYAALVDWHKRQSTLEEIGSDPHAYREKLRAELLAEMQEQHRASSPSPSVLPSNFSSSRNVGTRGAPAYAGPASIRDLLGK